MENTMGSRLKKLREKREMTLDQCARALGVPPSTYREWEYGRAIQGEPYPAMAKLFGISLYELFTGETPKHSQVLEKLELTKTALKNLENYLLSSL